MSGAGQGLTVQVATVLPVGKTGESGLAVAQLMPDATAGSADFGQILAEQFSGIGDSKPVAALVLAEEPGQILQQFDLLTGSSEQASTQLAPIKQPVSMESQPLNNEAAPMAAVLVAGAVAQISLDTDAVNGNPLPAGGEVLPVIAASEAARQQALNLETTTETRNSDLNPEPADGVINLKLQRAVIDADSLPADGITGDLPIQPLASVMQPATGKDSNGSNDENSNGDGDDSDIDIDDGSALTVSLETLGNTQVAGDVIVPTAVVSTAPDSSQDAAAGQVATSTSENPTRLAAILADGLQNRGLQIAAGIHLKQAEIAASGNHDPVLKTGLEVIRSATAAKPDSLITSADLTASGANPDATFAEYVTHNEPGTGSAWRSALLGYSKMESGQPVSVGIQIPVGQKGWTESVMERVFWLGGQHINNAEIHLDPPELGPLQLHISSKGDQTSVFFSSSHATVREALEQGLPRLKEMLESNGLQLLDVNVSDRSPQQQAREEARQIQSLAATEESQEVMEGRSLLIKVPQGLVDDYA